MPAGSRPAGAGLFAAAMFAAAVQASDYAPPPEDKARENVSRVVLAAAKSGARPKAWLDAMGRTQRMTLASADEKQVTVRGQGTEFSLAWERLSAKQLSALGLACVGRSARAALAVADLCLATGLRDDAGKALKKARELDGSLAGEVSARLAWLRRAASDADGEEENKEATPGPRQKRPAGGLDPKAVLKELTDLSVAGFHRRLGPDYAFYHKKKRKSGGDKNKSEEFPVVWTAPTKQGAKGRTYQVGGPWSSSAGDYGSTQGQILYATSSGVGVDRVTILEMAHGCYSERPTPPWWGGFRPDPFVSNWRRVAGGNAGVPVCMARGMAMWSNCGIIVLSSGVVVTAGTCTAKGSNPAARLARGKIPTAISVTPRNEFALITVVDVKEMKGQVAVVALESSSKESGFAHEWREHHPCLPNVAVYTGMKILGYVDLPGIRFPTGICGVGDANSVRLNGPDGHQTVLRIFDLAQEGHRRGFAPGGPNSGFTSSSGFAAVIAKHEDKVAFLDLQPLYQRVREMYFTTEENYRKTRDQGPAPGQWPYAFDFDPSWRPPVVRVLKHPRPTAVIASMHGGDGSRALVASEDGRIGIYRVGGLATSAPATPAEVALAGIVKVGRNPTCLAYQRYTNDTVIATSRGDREVAWVRYSGDTATVVRRLRDARLLDPVFVEAAETHGTEAAIVTVIDFKGRQALNYRYGDVVFATNGGARFPVAQGAPSGDGLAPAGPDGKAEFECGGALDFPGYPFCVSATNVN